MTKISKKTKSDNVQSHIKEAFAIIDEHLPERYVPLVMEKLKAADITNITSGTIRNVKSGGAKKCNNLPVLNAMLEVARDNEREKERLINSLNGINTGTDGNASC